LLFDYFVVSGIVLSMKLDSVQLIWCREKSRVAFLNVL
jgi:hypothetical protein